jgi:hypothetical protein
LEPLLRLSPPEGEKVFKSRRGFLVLRMMMRSRRELAFVINMASVNSERVEKEWLIEYVNPRGERYLREYSMSEENHTNGTLANFKKER